MVKFVWLDVPSGGSVPVNPDQVAYIKRSGAMTALVFGAVAGGLHELAVSGDGDEVAKRLESGVSAPGSAPAPKPGFSARKAKRRTPKAV